MPNPTLNQRLATNLSRLMKKKQLSANQLGKKAGVSPRTLGNYLKTDHNPTDTGKERSAKLTEVEKIAEALEVHPLELLAEIATERPAPAGVFYTPRDVLTKLSDHAAADVVTEYTMGSGSFLLASVEYLSNELANSDQVTRDAAAPLLERLAKVPEDSKRVAATLLAIIEAARSATAAAQAKETTPPAALPLAS